MSEEAKKQDYTSLVKRLRSGDFWKNQEAADVIEAQRQMREQIQDVAFCLMIATTLHSIAVGNLLPARVRVVCVDINPSTVIKLSDRGSFQTVGLVTDVEPFLRALVSELKLT